MFKWLHAKLQCFFCHEDLTPSQIAGDLSFSKKWIVWIVLFVVIFDNGNSAVPTDTACLPLTHTIQLNSIALHPTKKFLVVPKKEMMYCCCRLTCSSLDCCVVRGVLPHGYMLIVFFRIIVLHSKINILPW